LASAYSQKPPEIGQAPSALPAVVKNFPGKPHMQSYRTALICALLFFAAFVWRGVHLQSLGFLHVDEVRFAMPTAQDIAAGHLLFFIRGSNYGAPVQEAAAALLFRIFGESVIALRLPVVVFSSLAVVCGFLVLRRVERERVSLGLAILLAFPASAVTRYGVGAHPVYAFFTLLILALQSGAWWLDRHRSAKGWIAWALLAGFSVYVLKLAIVPIALILVWLGLRSNGFREWRRGFIGNPDLQRVWRRVGLLAGSAMLLFAPVFYRALTRRATYAPRTYELCLMLAGVFVMIVVLAFIVLKGRIPWRSLWPIGAVILATALFSVPPSIYFQRVEVPRLSAAGIEQWPEKKYNLKHAHEWPLQVRLFLDRIVPALILGRSNQLEGEPPINVPLTWKAALSAGLLGMMGVGTVRRLRRTGLFRVFRSRSFILIAPPVVIALLMFPSWALHSDTCFRYAVPFMAGIWLLFWKCLEPFVRLHLRATVGALAAYIVYCGVDCWMNLG